MSAAHARDKRNVCWSWTARLSFMRPVMPFEPTICQRSHIDQHSDIPRIWGLSGPGTRKHWDAQWSMAHEPVHPATRRLWERIVESRGPARSNDPRVELVKTRRANTRGLCDLRPLKHLPRYFHNLISLCYPHSSLILPFFQHI